MNSTGLNSPLWIANWPDGAWAALAVVALIVHFAILSTG